MTPDSMVLIKGERVLLYGLTSSGPVLLETYRKAEAIALGEQLIEAAIKIQRKTTRKTDGPSAPPPVDDHPCRSCGHPTLRGHLYCSHPCYIADRWGAKATEQPA